MSLGEHSKISMANGTLKDIKDIKVGDVVWGMSDLYRMRATKVTSIFETMEKECYEATKDLWVSKDHKIFSPSRNHRSAGYYSWDSLKEKDKLIFLDPKYTTKNSIEYKKGYLRGFVDGDGHIGNRGVFTCQKEKGVLEEFWNLYNQVVGETDTKIRYDESRDIYAGEGGYSKKFEEVTKIKFTEEYAKGYLAGILISDGCATYNKANKSFKYVLAQSSSANKEKCDIIEKMLDLLNISYTKWSQVSKCFNKEGCIMNYYGISKPWRIPLVYGSVKRDKMIQKCSEFGSLKNSPKVSLEKTNSNRKLNTYSLNTEIHSFFANGILVSD